MVSVAYIRDHPVYGRVRGFIVDEIGKRCGQIPDIHPRLLEGIEKAADFIYEDVIDVEALTDKVMDMGRAHAPHRNDPVGRGLVYRGRVSCSGISDPITGHHCQFIGTPQEQYAHAKERMRDLLDHHFSGATDG